MPFDSSVIARAFEDWTTCIVRSNAFPLTMIVEGCTASDTIVGIGSRYDALGLDMQLGARRDRHRSAGLSRRERYV